jgi:hypothetical protein
LACHSEPVRYRSGQAPAWQSEEKQNSKIKKQNDRAKFKNVVAQFIGQMRLMNQATTEIWR